MLQNVEFGLKMHGVGKAERRRLALGSARHGRPRGSSPSASRGSSPGGQQQRVALARVLVTKPKALLLDEPLGDLDRLLQLRMRVELRNLQRQLGLMFIHVTHNQEEALSMADRIVVMNDARIQQVADPLTIATRPETELVARFMGDNNIIHGTVASRDGDRLVLENGGVRASVRRAGRRPRGRRRGRRRRARGGRASSTPAARTAVSTRAECEIVFVEFLGDLSSSTCPPRATACSRSCRARSTERSAAARASASDRVEGGGCPAPPVTARPQLDIGEIEQAEEILEQRPPKAEAAHGAASEEARARRGLTALWAAPGLLWLGFYLIAPLVFIVLVSFWTYQVGASVRLRQRLDARQLQRALPRQRLLGQHAARASDRR